MNAIRVKRNRYFTCVFKLRGQIMKTGTNHFVDARRALDYYRQQDNEVTFVDISNKVEAGEIVLGKPPTMEPGQVLRVIEGRYWIEESDANAYYRAKANA
jgi:hypothetical protein